MRDARRVYLDECIEVYCTPYVVARRIDVTTARQAGMLGATDAEHLEHATVLQAVLVTHDINDYRRLHVRGAAGSVLASVIALPGSRNLDAPLRLEQLAIRIAMLVDELDGRVTDRFLTWGAVQRVLNVNLTRTGCTERDVMIALGRFERA